MPTFTGYEPKTLESANVNKEGENPGAASTQSIPLQAAENIRLPEYDTLSRDLFMLSPDELVEILYAPESEEPVPIAPAADENRARGNLAPSDPIPVAPADESLARGNLAHENSVLKTLAEQVLFLESEVSTLKSSLLGTRSEAQAYAESIQEQARRKARELHESQTKHFEKRAAEYEEEARDIFQREVAQTEADIVAQAESALQARDRALQVEQNSIENLRSHLLHAQSVATAEATELEKVISEAREAFQAQGATHCKERQRIIEEAEEALEGQKLAFSGEAHRHFAAQSQQAQATGLSLQAKIEDLQSKLSQAESKHVHLEAECDLARGNLAQERQLRTVAEDNLVKALETNRATNVTVSELESKINSLQTLLSEASSSSSSQARGNLAQEEKINEQNEEIEQLQVNVEFFQKQAASFKEKNEHLDFQLKTAEKMVQQLNQEVEQLQEECKREQAEAELKRLVAANASAENKSLPSDPRQNLKTNKNAQVYQLDLGDTADDTFQPARGNLSRKAPTFFPTGLTGATQQQAPNGGSGAQTPALSAIREEASQAFGTSGRQVAEKISMGGWPSIKGFRVWKLAFKKAVAAAS